MRFRVSGVSHLVQRFKVQEFVKFVLLVSLVELVI